MRPQLHATMANDNKMCDTSQSFNVISYNMHGFNSGCEMIRDLISASEIDIFLLQEHWLTPANLSRFDDYFPDYYCFGSSAMQSCVEQGNVANKIAKVTDQYEVSVFYLDICSVIPSTSYGRPM